MPTTESTFTILRFPDLSALQWDLVSPVVKELSERHRVEVVEVTPAQRRSLRRGGHGGIYWVLAADWRRAVKFLSPSAPAKVFVSVFEVSLPRRSLSTLFLKSFAASMPRCVNLIAYSSLNYRFFREIEGLDSRCLHQLPLALPAAPPARSPAPGGSAPAVVGTYAPLVAESNLHYLLNVAHYVVHRNPATEFRILGSGPLYHHLSSIVRDIGLERSVTISEGADPARVAELDIFLYVPLRNDHFGPLLHAGACSRAVLANEVPGIEEFISDGNDGFVLPVNETKPMGELVLRLIQTPGLRELLGKKLSAGMEAKYSVKTIVRQCEGIFFGAPTHREISTAVAEAS